MKKITIPFSGITRNTDDGISPDGECMELINARIKNGSLSPIGKPILEITFPNGRKPIYIHQNSGYTHFLSYSESNILYHEYNKDSEGYHPIGELICEIPGLINIESLGNTLICITQNGIIYILFDKTYKVLGNKPDYNVSFTTYNNKSVDTSEYTHTFEFQKGADFINTNKFDDREIPKIHDTIESYREKAIAPFSSEKRFINPVLVRYALRMYNGEYIHHSPVVLICPEYDIYLASEYFQGTTSAIADISGNTLGLKIKQTVKSYCIKCSIDFPNFNTWKDIISSIDVFVSRELDLVDKTKLIYSNPPGGGTWGKLIIKTIPEDSVVDKVANESLFYKTLTIPGAEGGEKAISPCNVSDELLPDDDFSRNILSAKSSFIYNSRLHLGNIKSKLFEGFLKEIIQNSDTDGVTSALGVAIIKSYTYINTDSGEKIVYNELYSNVPALNPYIFYPDPRATKIEYYADILNNGIRTYHSKTIKLKNSKTLNAAYYINYGGSLDNPDGFTPINLNSGSLINAEKFKNPGIEIDSWVSTPNKLKVSSLNNPFVFPVEQTYDISNGGIIGMATATSALSQGQFGQFPLYVFCRDGIYSLSVGSGKIAYSTSSPVSRDACNNPKGITSIDNAVVFSTDAGLMLISGSTIKKLSDKIEGYLPSCFVSSPVIQRIIHIPELHTAISSTEFRYYIENASIGYNYQEKEIIISNSNFNYSYVLNMNSGEWCKISGEIDSFLNSYPDTLAVCGNSIYNIQNHHRSISKIAILSRPVKMGSLTHKRILQSALRGIVRPSISDVYLRGEPVMFRGEDLTIFSECGFYILGSNDAEHFSFLAGTEKINDIRDLITKMNKTKACKYFMFCLVGGVRTDVSLNYVEVIADETYENRLR